MSSEPSSKPFGITPLVGDGSTVGLLFVMLGSLALGCLAALAFVAAFPYPTVSSTSGVVGIVTVQGYPKSRDSVYYALIVLLVAATAIACAAAWLFSGRSMARRLALDGEVALNVAASAYLPCFAGLGVGLLFGRRVVPTFIATLATVVAANAALLAWPRRGSRALLAGAALGRQLFGAGGRLPAAIVALAGCVFGWFVPMAVPSRFAPALASAWWVAPLGFLGVWWATTWFVTRRAGEPFDRAAPRAALVLTPALIMLAVPFLIDFPGLRAAVLVLTLISLVMLAVSVIGRPGPAISEAGVRAILRVSGTAGLVVLTLAWCWLPDLPGILVPPGDGDHLLAFLNDGLHGKMVYRDFWYPYGPLAYQLDLISARISGLDRYYFPSWFVTMGLATLLLCVTARVVFLAWPFRVLGSLLLILAWPPAPVQFRAYAGYLTAVLAVAAAASGRAWVLRTGGVLGAVGYLFSNEAGIAALIGAQPGFLWACREATLRGTLRTYARRLRPFLTGLLGVLGAVALLASWLGALGPYVRSTFGFVAVNDECCGLPMPGLWEGPAPAGLSWSSLKSLAHLLLLSDVFRYFYLPGLLYIAAALYVVARPFRGRPVLRQDAVLLGIAGFGLLYFRYTLGRSDMGRALLAAMPALVVGSALLERVALRMVRLLRPGQERGRRGPAWLAELAILAGSFVFLGARLGFSEVPGLLGAATKKLAQYHQLRHQPRDVYGWKAVVSDSGARFYFTDPVAPIVQATVDYLRAHTQPGEGVFAFPYAFRYNVLLDRPNPLTFGSCLWSAAARPADQQRLIRELVQKRPRYIIYDESEWPDLDGVPTGDRFADLADFIFTSYGLERKIGETSVLRLIEGGPVAPPSVVEVASDEQRGSLQRGWYYPHRAGPVMARWTATTATARLTRRAAQRTLFVDCYVEVPAGHPSRTLSAAVEGSEVGRVDLSTRGGWTSLRFPLPESTAQSAAVLVRLDIDPFPAPGDRRRLGLTVTRLGVE